MSLGTYSWDQATTEALELYTHLTSWQPTAPLPGTGSSKLNLLLVGPTSHGKSCLVNTVGTAFSTRFVSYAKAERRKEGTTRAYTSHDMTPFISVKEMWGWNADNADSICKGAFLSALSGALRIDSLASADQATSTELDAQTRALHQIHGCLFVLKSGAWEEELPRVRMFKEKLDALEVCCMARYCWKSSPLAIDPMLLCLYARGCACGVQGAELLCCATSGS
jgi:hypothetical protein